MSIGQEPITDEEREIATRGVGYLFKDTRISLYLREDIIPERFSEKVVSFSVIHCLPNYEEDNGIITIANTLRGMRIRGCDSKRKLFQHYNYLRHTLKNNPNLTLIWEGEMNDAYRS